MIYYETMNMLTILIIINRSYVISMDLINPILQNFIKFVSLFANKVNFIQLFVIMKIFIYFVILQFNKDE